MQKISAVKVMIILMLVSFCCNPLGTQPRYGNQICPLSRYNMEIAENLMEIIQKKLDEVHKEGLDTSDIEAMVIEANELLRKAKIYNLQSHNCVTGNIYAIKAIKLLEKSLEMLESKLNALRNEEYSVYAALIDTGFSLIEGRYIRDEIQLIVIIDHTYGCEPDEDLNEVLEWVGQKMPLTEKETLDNFQLKNAESHPLGDYFNLTVEVVLVSIEEIREIFQEDNGWKEFYATYPFSQGIMTLSRVGFNAEMDQALLYVEDEWDDCIGSGHYILFTKENGVWTIQSWVISWIY